MHASMGGLERKLDQIAMDGAEKESAQATVTWTNLTRRPKFDRGAAATAGVDGSKLYNECNSGMSQGNPDWSDENSVQKNKMPVDTNDGRPEPNAASGEIDGCEHHANSLAPDDHHHDHRDPLAQLISSTIGDIILDTASESR
jgi:hypothetical protein